ncbi:MAG: metal-dependent hydrolase [Actinomycetota bacterium]
MTAIDSYRPIEIRKVPFDFPDDLDPVWHPGHHEWSHMINGASLTMPYLEPFLIATLRAAAAEIDDPAILEEISGFVGQEAQHFRTHRRYNELLKANGYPELAEVETAMKASYDKLKTRSLTFRLAYSAGFESMTLGVTKWLVENRVELFAGSDTRVASFALWHMVEEVEHKRVAFDAYQAACGHRLHRALGVFTGSLHVFLWARKACVVMLKKDGRWRNPRSRLRLWRRTGQFFAAIVPGALRSAMPGHDPRDEPDPEWVERWIEGFATWDDADGPPLIDTNDGRLDVPFATSGATS